jgi:hypothetical protein
MPTRGYSLRIFLPDGTPDGLRIVEKSNWTGRGIVCPRSRFSNEKKRAEFRRTGVYILTGPATEGEFPAVYIGEGDPAGDRLEQHHAKKDFWTSLILFTSKDENLNKAHVQYLESRLIRLAHDARRCTLENGNIPQLPSMSESDVAEMECFLDEMRLIFPVIDLNVFEKPALLPHEKQLLFLRAKGLTCKGYDSPQGFVVLKNSQAQIKTVPSIHKYTKYIIILRQTLLKKGILEKKNDHLILTQDYSFDSPSTAAGVMMGRNANGRIEWKDKTGRTLKEIQAASVKG